jgi:hypothetical protein
MLKTLKLHPDLARNVGRPVNPTYDGWCVPFETILPEQLYNQHPLSPEQKLMFALIEDAALVLSKGKCHNRGEWERAADWLGTTGVAIAGFSFEYACESLGLDVEYIAQGLMALSGEDL